MKSKLLRATSIALAAIFACTLASGEDSSIWLAFNTPKKEISDNWSTKTNFEFRIPDASELTYYRVGQKFATKLPSDWTFGTALAFENSKKASDWNHTFRLEFEMNPKKFSLGENGPDLSMRNRWELRWKEGKGSEIFHRVRHQSKITWKLSNGPFSSFGIGDELFFEEDKGKITANRFYPVLLSTSHGEVKGSYFLMYQSKRSGTSSDWSGEYILGAGYSF